MLDRIRDLGLAIRLWWEDKPRATRRMYKKALSHVLAFFGILLAVLIAFLLVGSFTNKAKAQAPAGMPQIQLACVEYSWAFFFPELGLVGKFNQYCSEEQDGVPVFNPKGLPDPRADKKSAPKEEPKAEPEAPKEDAKSSGAPELPVLPRHRGIRET